MTNEAEDEDFKELVNRITYSYEIQEERNSAEYDGILGRLPEWAPEPVHNEFRRVRNFVLDGWGYDPGTAVEWLKMFHSENHYSDIFQIPATYPNGQNLDALFWMDKLGYLAHIQWAVVWI